MWTLMDTYVCPGVNVWTEKNPHTHTSYGHLVVFTKQYFWGLFLVQLVILWLFLFYVQPHKTDSYTAKKTP